MRVGDLLTGVINHHTRCLGITRTQFVKDAIEFYVAGGKGWKECPTCGNPIERMEVGEGDEEIRKLICVDGHTHYFDYEDMKWVK